MPPFAFRSEPPSSASAHASERTEPRSAAAGAAGGAAATSPLRSAATSTPTPSRTQATSPPAGIAHAIPATWLRRATRPPASRPHLDHDRRERPRHELPERPGPRIRHRRPHLDHRPIDLNRPLHRALQHRPDRRQRLRNRRVHAVLLNSIAAYAAAISSNASDATITRPNWISASAMTRSTAISNRSPSPRFIRRNSAIDRSNTGSNGTSCPIPRPSPFRAIAPILLRRQLLQVRRIDAPPMHAARDMGHLHPRLDRP